MKKQYSVRSFMLVLTLCMLFFLSNAHASSNTITPMQKGSRGEDVQKVQERLIELGYLSDVADGIFGNNTENAVRCFQADNELAVFGVVGQVEMEIMFSESNRPESSISDDSSDVMLYADRKSDIDADKYDFNLTFDEGYVVLNGYTGQSIDLTIPDLVNDKPITKISESAFEGNRIIKSVKLPSHLTLVGSRAFYDSSISGVISLPSSLKTVATYAFQSTDITGLIIQSDCSMGICAFSNLLDLKFVYIRDGYSPVLDSFGYLPSLEVAIIPSTVTEIRDGTFNNCDSLKIITQSGSYAEQYAHAHSILCETDTYDEYVRQYEELYPKDNEEDTHFFFDVDKFYEYQGVYKDDEYGLTYIVIDKNRIIEFSFYDEKKGGAMKSDYEAFQSEFNGEPCLYFHFYEGREDEALSWFILSYDNGERCINYTSCFNRDNKYSYRSSVYKPVSNTSLKKLNDRYEKSASKTKPYVGMLSSQVLDSTWGEPKKVNKTTYSWGVSEQWVYGNGRYVYLENGIVTAVQE